MANQFVKTVCRAMERIAPLRLAEPWDNVGLLLESPIQKSPHKRVLLTIDLTTPVLHEALAKEVSLIISYHAPLFRPVKSLTMSNSLQASLLRCAAEGISVYTPHTALDSVWNGINDWLAEGLAPLSPSSSSVAVLEKKVGENGEDLGGLGRLFTYDSPVRMGDLLQRIKNHIGREHIEVAYPEPRPDTINSVAICAGGGGSVLLGRNADVYWTGEMSHHEVLAAVAAGKHVILCGHTNTERGYLPTLKKMLTNELNDPEAEILVSEKDEHPLKFV